MRSIRTVVLSLALTAVAVTAAGCQPADKAGAGGATGTSTLAPAGAATPSPTVDLKKNTTEVCKAVTKVIIDGSVTIADDSVKSIDEGWSDAKRNKSLQTVFKEVGAGVTAEADKALDPELKKTIEESGAAIAAGAKKKDGLAFLKKDFQYAAEDVDKACGK